MQAHFQTPLLADLELHQPSRAWQPLSHPDSLACQSSLVDMQGPQAQELKQFIQTIFWQAHRARIKHFMPNALCLRDRHQQLLAVTGLRGASQSSLFLERYLHEPVQNVIAQRSGESVTREHIIEIGNLAVSRPAYTQILMAALSAYLYATETRWIVFSALPVVRNAVAKMQHQMLVLADATIQEIAPEEQADWGTYYQHQPQVIALRLQRQQAV